MLHIVWTSAKLCATFVSIAKHFNTIRCSCGLVAVTFFLFKFNTVIRTGCGIFSGTLFHLQHNVHKPREVCIFILNINWRLHFKQYALRDKDSYLVNLNESGSVYEPFSLPTILITMSWPIKFEDFVLNIGTVVYT